MHRSGFVNIIGNPNVGKSTLMNALVGERLSIVTSKAQTTRHRIMGIVNGDDYQIVYSDTPGILKPNYKLQESMMGFVNTAMSDADVMLYVTDVVEKGTKNIEYLERLKSIQTPVLLVINKVDLSNQQDIEELYQRWRELLPNAEIFPISATEKFNLDPLFNRILELIPESPAWYDKDIFTDK
ncbi:MAG: GTPase Era, partial [Bacteroidales bacterium]|nr:GTPase Era [Bacteroidales bacterium]